jgi:NAD+ diphosphatase
MTVLQPFAIPSHFLPATEPDRPMVNAWWFICAGSSLAVVSDFAFAYRIPQAASITELGVVPVRSQFLGYLDDCACVAVELPKTAELPSPLLWQNLRELHGVISEADFAIAALAIQLIEWDRTHQYCGHCATPTAQLPSERAKHCPACQLRQYPRLSPAVIMLVYRGEEVLLARSPRFRPGLYSVLAGFVEPGESLEAAVAREVREEVGIEVQNIRYFGSQPWPFPHSLMVGFIAEYAGGVITPEPGEIEAAAWFDKSALPPVPGEPSIAHRLINWFISW